ncbi:hypothetical protein LCGC14_0918640 [marine sediment metagenome]|uniref:Uncharacterized protein n=1 Tax=marine sediment metagenome TaxID=412755 RepID=A0A0F9RA62_9ZZZZ
MQVADMSAVRKGLIEEIETRLNAALEEDRGIIEGMLTEALGQDHNLVLPPYHGGLTPHEFAIRLEAVLDTLLHDHSADAEDSFMALSITGKCESVTIKDEGKEISSFAFDEPGGGN